MRGQLPEHKLQEIDSLLPQLDDRFPFAAFPGPSVDLYDLTHNGHLGISLACLSDSGYRLQEMRLGLHEAYACLAWYREETAQPSEFEAVLTSRFYIDHVAMLLYAAAEDIAAFIINFLECQDGFVRFAQNLRNARVTSNAAKVGMFLRQHFADHDITNIIFTLHRTPEWDQALEYRNKWVHEQPPLVDGLGIQLNRLSRISEDGTSISFGGGAPPEYTIDQLLEIMHQATIAFAACFSQLLDIVIQRREALGERFEFDE
ncbi:MAG TPA: hypothetical protein VFU22_20920 [Roseiflexaceae bacterium]|nr:hypothetical protein [Roseiflexaceae bacterium]